MVNFLEIYIVDDSGSVEILNAGFLIPASEKQMNFGIRETIFFTLQSFMKGESVDLVIHNAQNN